MTALLTALLAVQLSAPPLLSGTVHDSTGAAINNAVVAARATNSAAGSERDTRTGPDGRFRIEITWSGATTITVRAGGFAEQSVSIRDPARVSGLGDITLPPAPPL